MHPHIGTQRTHTTNWSIVIWQYQVIRRAGQQRRFFYQNRGKKWTNETLSSSIRNYNETSLAFGIYSGMSVCSCVYVHFMNGIHIWLVRIHQMWYSSDITWCHTKCYISRNLPQMNGTRIRYSCVVMREASVENVQKFTNYKRCRKQFKCESLHHTYTHMHAHTHTHVQTHIHSLSVYSMCQNSEWWGKNEQMVLVSFLMYEMRACTNTNTIKTMVVWFNRLVGMFRSFFSFFFIP